MKIVFDNKKSVEDVLKEVNLVKSLDIMNNNIYFGDNLIFLRSLAKQNIKFKSIYIDPPFSKNQTFKNKHNETAYDDMLDGDEFLSFIQERVILSHMLLKEDGFFSLHIDQKIGHYIKILCDEIFGINNFVAEIVTNRVKKNHKSNNFNIATDSIYLYRKSDKAILNPLFKETAKKPYWHAFDAKGQGSAKLFDGKLIEPPAGTHWRWSQEKIDQAMQDKILRLNSKGKPEYLVSPEKEKIDTNWCDIPGYSFKTGYPTEKNVDILKRIILSTSNENDLVLDFFGGSGTTVAACLETKRQFLSCDKSSLSIETMKKRFAKENIMFYNIE